MKHIQSDYVSPCRFKIAILLKITDDDYYFAIVCLAVERQRAHVQTSLLAGEQCFHVSGKRNVWKGTTSVKCAPSGSWEWTRVAHSKKYLSMRRENKKKEERNCVNLGTPWKKKKERRKFPLGDEKITILPNRQLIMLNPLRTIGIFSLPTVILSRS